MHTMSTATPVAQTLSIRIQQILSDMGISQADLCRMTGLQRNYVSQLLRGKMVPRADRLLVIARCLGTTSEELLDNSLNTLDRHAGAV